MFSAQPGCEHDKTSHTGHKPENKSLVNRQYSELKFHFRIAGKTHVFTSKTITVIEFRAQMLVVRFTGE